MAVLLSIVLTGCRKQEKDIEALSREAVEDEVSAVLDSLERASKSRRDTLPLAAISPRDVHRPVGDTAPVTVVEPEPAVESNTPPTASVPTDESTSVSADTAVAGTAETPQQGKPGWVIQIGTFNDYVAALAEADKYKQLTYPAFVRRVNKAGKTFYRLRIGVYDTYEQAKAVEEELRSRYSLETWIARNQ
jgi:cell division septation protein DedD